MKTKILAFLIAVSMMVPAIPVMASGTQADTVSTVDEIRSANLAGDEVNAAAVCANGIKGNGTGGVYIDIKSAPYTTFAQIANWGQYAYTNQGCAWFASARVKELTGIGNMIYSGYSWYHSQGAACGFTKGNVIREKAIACYSGHVAIVEKIIGSTVIISEGGYNASGMQPYGYTIIRETDVNGVEHNGGNDFLGYVYLPGSSSEPVNLFSSVYTENVTETEATLKASLNSTYSVSTCGVYVGSDPNNMQKITETVNGSVKTLWYGMNKWYGILSPGTTYYYQFYVVVGGQEYKSGVQSFTTRGATSEFPLQDGIYCHIINQSNGMAMDIEYAGEGAKVVQAPLNRWNRNQFWKVIKYADGYAFQSIGTGFVLDIYGCSTENWTEIKQYALHGGTNQRFKMVHRTNGYYSLHPVCSGLAVSVHLGTSNVGEKLVQYEYTGAADQHWGFQLADTTPPTISNVRVVNRTSDSYTVTCTVTDNVGIEKVQFPTWTDANGQDDLAAEWWDNPNCKGTRNGNEYSFTVKKSDHNNENGYYTTHIYAYDTSGNSISGGINCEISPSGSISINWPFTDVAAKSGNWKYEAVKYVYDNKIMNGVGDGTRFNPDAPLTREMFATVLYRMAGEPAVSFKNKFPDVPGGKWYSKAVIWASEQGIVSGYGSGKFGTGHYITREQIAKMLNEYGKKRGYNVSQRADFRTFMDAGKVSSWAKDYMKWAVGSGMISGSKKDGKSYLNPQGNATRAECATMLKRFIEKYQ